MDRGRQQEQVGSGQHHRRTEDRLVLGGFALLLVVGGTLMLLILGQGPAAFGVGVILLVAGLLLALYKGFDLLEWWLKEKG